jgi:hypothetical protein
MTILPTSLRTIRLTSESEDSSFFNTLKITGVDGTSSLPETPFNVPLDVTFDPTAVILPETFLLDSGQPPLPARVQLFADNGDGALGGGDTLISEQLVTELTWDEVLAASNNGTRDIILAIDDDGNNNDGDFNDFVILGDVNTPETPPPCEQTCEPTEFKLKFVSEDSFFNNTLVVFPESEAPQSIEENSSNLEQFYIDDTNLTQVGNFILDNEGGNPAAARVQIWVDDGDLAFDPGVGGDTLADEMAVTDLTIQDLATASEGGNKDLFLAFDDDGLPENVDFNDLVVFADFYPADCKEEPCIISEATFTSYSESSYYFNTLNIIGAGDTTGSVEEVEGSAVVQFDGSSTEAGYFSLFSGEGIDASLARVQVFADVNGDGELTDADDPFLFESALSALTWDDLVGASENGAVTLFLAIDDDGNDIDEDYNDIVVKFVGTPCEDNSCGCDGEYWPPNEASTDLVLVA